MSVFNCLSVLALRQLVGGACNAVGLSGSTDMVVDFLSSRFSDQSLKLTNALQTANERAWKTLEIALAGDSFWDRCKSVLAAAEDKAFAQQVRSFLDSSPFKRVTDQHGRVYQAALNELRAARSRGSLRGERPAFDQLARETAAFARFADPQAQLDAEWKVIEQTANEIRDRCPNLSNVLRAKPRSTQNPTILKPSIMALAVRYYFRREVEADRELFQGLAFAKLETLQESQDKGFAAISLALAQQGQRLEKLLNDLVVVGTDTNFRVQRIEQQIHKMLELLQLNNREVRPGDSMSIRSETEQMNVRQVVGEYRALPDEVKRQRPKLLNEVGKLEVAAGAFEDAQKDFTAAADALGDPKSKAEAHHNAYQAALERRNWAEALASLRQAMALDPERFAPFPDRYEPTRILGAGGFGVAFLCRHKFMRANVVVKTLQIEELDCNVDRVFTEAQALGQLNHPSIIRLSDCGYANAIGKPRPYLAMDYFEGVNLESYVEEHGELSTDDLLTVAHAVAEALQAAHARSILHRDVKPANLLIRRDESGWRVKLIDFGLALSPSTIEGQLSTQGPRAQTTMGKSIAGTVHYAAPEQMGQLEGVAVGPYSDVYGFGRSCYFALFGTPEPDDEEKENLPDSWRRLLSKCTGRKLANRLPDFTAVLAGLEQIRQAKTATPLPPPHPVPPFEDKRPPASLLKPTTAKTFNGLLRESNIALSDVRLLRETDRGDKERKSLYEDWRGNHATFETRISFQKSKNRKKLTAPYWAVFLVNPANETMFAGLYSVEYSGSIALDDDEDDNNCTDYYEITLQDALRSLIGKLVIDWGAGAVAWVQYPDRQDKVITELRDRSEADQPEPSPHRKTLPPVSPTDDEQRSSDRQRLQLKFWQSLLNRPKAKTTRHCNISPSDCGWISASSGLRGVNFSYVISKDEARIDLYIDRGVGQTETNKRIFDSLHSQKKKIEKGFGEELSWQRLDEKRACRIAYTLPIGGYRSDESKWPEIQDLMIDGMILLEKALLPHIENLKTELVSENRYIPKQQNYGSKQMTPGTLEIDGEQATIDDKEVWQSSSKKLAAMLNKNYVPESTSVGTAWVIAFYTAVKDFDAKIITAPDVSGFPDPMEDDGEV